MEFEEEGVGVAEAGCVLESLEDMASCVGGGDGLQ